MNDERCIPGRHYGCACDDAALEAVVRAAKRLLEAKGTVEHLYQKGILRAALARLEESRR